ncbi:hypothetical protein PR048_006177 [Dryococelus australis]|uniref:Uncharacterized protein n=1 Tax=Dryococelus australis TaxID=614101 RepID=A0ABQ9IA92_9NEOP|nr:hypothetical protein PR048_006177 [Dryococelus australis]
MDAACVHQARYIICKYPVPMRSPREAIHEVKCVWAKTRPLSSKVIAFQNRISPKIGKTLYSSGKTRKPTVGGRQQQQCMEMCDPADLLEPAMCPATSHDPGPIPLLRRSCLQSHHARLRRHQCQPGGEESAQRHPWQTNQHAELPALPSSLLIPPSVPAAAEAGKEPTA